MGAPGAGAPGAGAPETGDEASVLGVHSHASAWPLLLAPHTYKNIFLCH